MYTLPAWWLQVRQTACRLQSWLPCVDYLWKVRSLRSRVRNVHWAICFRVLCLYDRHVALLNTERSQSTSLQNILPNFKKSFHICWPIRTGPRFKWRAWLWYVLAFLPNFPIEKEYYWLFKWPEQAPYNPVYSKSSLRSHMTCLRLLHECRPLSRSTDSPFRLGRCWVVKFIPGLATDLYSPNKLVTSCVRGGFLRNWGAAFFNEILFVEDRRIHRLLICKNIK